MLHTHLAAIADAFIPTMGLLALVLLVINSLKKSQQINKWMGIFLFLVVQLGFAYAMMMIDHAWPIWAKWQGDYSTHTTVSMALVTAACFLAKPIRLWLIGSWLAYLVLMIFMRYHTPWDIVTSAAYQGVAILMLRRWWQHF